MASGGFPCGCPEGIATCEEVWDCMQTHLCTGAGLGVNPQTGCLGVQLGSCLGFDGAGRITYICGEAPAPGPCRTSVQQLVDGGFFIGGARGGAGLRVAWGSPQAIDYALSVGVPMIEGSTFALSDGVATWAPLSRSGSLSYYSNNPANDAWARQSNEWVNMTSDPGTLDNYTGRNKAAPPVFKSPDGGYFGYKMPQFNLMTLEQALRRIDGRAVAMLYAVVNGNREAQVQAIEACIQAIGQACAHSWTIVMVSQQYPELADMLTSANLPACFDFGSTPELTPQEVIDTGVSWVRIWDEAEDDVIQPFIDAGLHVLIRSNGRHYEVERARDLGAAGVLSLDPVYSKDEFPTDQNFSMVGRGPFMGTFDYWSDQLDLDMACGFTINDSGGIHSYVNPTLVSNAPSASGFFQNILLGNMRSKEQEQPSSYSISFQMRTVWDSQPVNSASRIGIAFGSLTDTDLSANSQDNVYDDRYSNIRTGYFAFVRVGVNQQGQIGIFRFTGGAAETIAETSVSRNWSQGVWNTFNLLVTPTGINWGWENASVAISNTDTTYRGKYLYLGHWASSTDPGTWTVGFRNINAEGLA